MTNNLIYESLQDKIISAISCALGFHIYTHRFSKDGTRRIYYCRNCGKISSIWREPVIMKPKFYIPSFGGRRDMHMPPKHDHIGSNPIRKAYND